MPDYEAVKDGSGGIVDIKVSYPQDFTKQMLEYSAFTKQAKKEARERVTHEVADTR